MEKLLIVNEFVSIVFDKVKTNKLYTTLYKNNIEVGRVFERNIIKSDTSSEAEEVFGSEIYTLIKKGDN